MSRARSASVPATTRTHFQEELAKLEQQALGGLDMVVSAIDRALETVQQQDVELASMVIADDDRIDGRYLEVQQGILSLLALQAPVAGDLRIVAALLHAMKNIERMGDQCVNMAKLVPLAGHEPPSDERILTDIQSMGDQARRQVIQCKQAFERRDVPLAQDLVRQDDEIDRLNREVFRLALDIGEQTVFVVTGLFREFEDASHPELAPP